MDMAGVCDEGDGAVAVLNVFFVGWFGIAAVVAADHGEAWPALIASGLCVANLFCVFDALRDFFHTTGSGEGQ